MKKITKQDVKDFVERRKTELIVAGGTVVALGLGAFYLSKRKSTDLEIPELDIDGEVTNLYGTVDGYMACVKDINIKDLGEFGEQFIDRLDGITEDSNTWLVVGMEYPAKITNV